MKLGGENYLAIPTSFDITCGVETARCTRVLTLRSQQRQATASSSFHVINYLPKAPLSYMQKRPAPSDIRPLRQSRVRAFLDKSSMYVMSCITGGCCESWRHVLNVFKRSTGVTVCNVKQSRTSFYFRL